MALSFGFASIEHYAASAFSDLHKAFQFVIKEVPVVSKSETVVEGVTALVTGSVNSPAVLIERAAFSALGSVAAAVQAADAAEQAKGINVTLDAEAVAAYKALIAQFQSELKSLGYSL